MSVGAHPLHGFTRIVVWVLLLGLATASSAQPPWKISVLYWSDTIAGQLAMREGLRRQVRRFNQQAREHSGQRTIVLTEYVAGDGPEGVERQIAQFYQALKTTPDLVIAQPADSAALTEPLRQANRKQIPVLAYDQFIEGGQLAGLVTSNNYQAGYLAGEVVADLFPSQHVLRLVLLEYPLVSSTVLRVDGFLDALEDLGQAYTLLHTYRAIESVSGRQAAKALLRDYPQPGSVDVVFSVNDGAGLAFRRELEKAGRRDIRLASVDGDPEQVASLSKNGLLLVDSAQLCAVIGEQTVRAAVQWLNGDHRRLLYQVPTYPVTLQTREGYKGWYGEIPAPFTKPWMSRKPSWSHQIKILNLQTDE